MTINELRQYWDKILDLWEINPDYMLIRKGYNYFVASQGKSMESFDIEMGLIKDFKVSISIFVDEPLEESIKSVCVGVYRNKDCLILDTMPLDEVIERTKRCIDKINDLSKKDDDGDN